MSLEQFCSSDAEFEIVPPRIKAFKPTVEKIIHKKRRGNNSLDVKKSFYIILILYTLTTTSAASASKHITPSMPITRFKISFFLLYLPKGYLLRDFNVLTVLRF